MALGAPVPLLVASSSEGSPESRMQGIVTLELTVRVREALQDQAAALSRPASCSLWPTGLWEGVLESQEELF